MWSAQTRSRERASPSKTMHAESPKNVLNRTLWGYFWVGPCSVRLSDPGARRVLKCLGEKRLIIGEWGRRGARWRTSSTAADRRGNTSGRRNLSRRFAHLRGSRITHFRARARPRPRRLDVHASAPSSPPPSPSPPRVRVRVAALSRARRRRFYPPSPDSARIESLVPCRSPRRPRRLPFAR